MVYQCGCMSSRSSCMFFDCKLYSYKIILSQHSVMNKRREIVM